MELQGPPRSSGPGLESACTSLAASRIFYDLYLGKLIQTTLSLAAQNITSLLH